MPNTPRRPRFRVPMHSHFAVVCVWCLCVCAWVRSATSSMASVGQKACTIAGKPTAGKKSVGVCTDASQCVKGNMFQVSGAEKEILAKLDDTTGTCAAGKKCCIHTVADMAAESAPSFR